MSKYVLDASVAVKWELNEIDSPKALRLREDYRHGLHQFIAPDIFPVEVAHALTRAERKRLVPAGQAGHLLAQVLNTRPVLHASLRLLPSAVELSSQTRASVYDCLYLVLAEEQGIELLTADEKLLKMFPGAAMIDLSKL